MTYRNLDAKEVATYIRQDLKSAFPRTKFSVKISRYSMGSSVHIEWTDGPSAKQVEVITSALNFYQFDGMTDMASTADAAPYRGELVRATCSISTERNHTAAPCELAIQHVRDYNHADADADQLAVTPKYTPDHYCITSTERNQYDRWSARSIAYEYLNDWTEYPEAITTDELAAQQWKAEQAERAERDAPIRADIAQITDALTEQGHDPRNVYQTAEGQYTATLHGATLKSGQPLTLTGTPEQIIRMASRRAPIQQAAPEQISTPDDAGQVVEMTAEELQECQDAARAEWAGKIPDDLLELCLKQTAAQIKVTTQPAYLTATELPRGPRVLN